DRSPCGTGTSAKIACLAEAGTLAPDTDWIQESVVGSRFIARYSLNDKNEIIPSITGRAFICAEGVLVQQAGDPFAEGIG
ncbi:MAG: proline racemase family protein, partial [Gammaproteobacteria bacterium]|nr:proline racemase family protein [Gammaproteobacteria bacterium]